MSLNDFSPAFLSLSEEGAIVIAQITHPHLSEDENIEQMARELITLIDHYQRHQIVLCLAKVVYVTSAALGKLIVVHRKLHRQGGRMVLCGAHSTVAEVLQTSRLNEYFTIAPDIPTAVAVLTAA
jgi:anti-sigma B factor antagonist